MLVVAVEDGFSPTIFSQFFDHSYVGSAAIVIAATNNGNWNRIVGLVFFFLQYCIELFATV